MWRLGGDSVGQSWTEEGVQRAHKGSSSRGLSLESGITLEVGGGDGDRVQLGFNVLNKQS